MKSIRTCFFVLSMLVGASSNAASFTVGAFPELNPAPAIAIPPDTFLVPVNVIGANGLQSFQFDLLYDPTVVRFYDPFLVNFTSGVYGAEFIPGDTSTESSIVAAFPTIFPDRIDDVFGLYPFLTDGVTGNGTLAYILFEYVDGQEGNDPNFRFADTFINGISTTPVQVPEPSVLLLLAGALLIFGVQYRRT